MFTGLIAVCIAVCDTCTHNIPVMAQSVAVCEKCNNMNGSMFSPTIINHGCISAVGRLY